jgi:hypothetical protein
MLYLFFNKKKKECTNECLGKREICGMKNAGAKFLCAKTHSPKN